MFDLFAWVGCGFVLVFWVAVCGFVLVGCLVLWLFTVAYWLLAVCRCFVLVVWLFDLVYLS